MGRNGGRHQRVKCGNCGKEVALLVNGSGPRAHNCPHGRTCVRPAWMGRVKGEHFPPCPDCAGEKGGAPCTAA